MSVLQDHGGLLVPFIFELVNSACRDANDERSPVGLADAANPETTE
jgi:hypothetical protein